MDIKDHVVTFDALHTQKDTALYIAEEKKADPSRILQLNRGHWSIENKLHYVRDVAFHEDRSSIRTCNAPRIIASLKNCIISIFRFLRKTNIIHTLRDMTYKPHLALKFLHL